MNNKTFLLSIVLLVSSWSFAQTNDFDRHIGISLKASTNGFGGDLYYQPTKKIAIKAGTEFLSLTIKSSTIERFVGEDINISIPMPAGSSNMTFNADAKFKTGALSLAVGYQPFKLMYVTAGIAKTLFSSEVIGASQSDIVFAGYDIPTIGTVIPMIAKDKLGVFNVTINSKNSIIPYVGIGLGSYVPDNKRFSFALELGAYYVGNYALEYTLPPGLTVESVDYGPNITQEQKDLYFSYISDDVQSAVADVNREIDATMNDINRKLNNLKFYPVLKFTVGFRAFEF